MSLARNFTMMAHYNQRVNRQLMALCLTLPEEKLKQQTNSFFPNVLSYWNHILFGDLILLGRMASLEVAGLSPELFDTLPTPKSPTDIYSESISELAELRERVDVLILNYCTNLSEQNCAAMLSYTTTEGQNVTKAVADVIQHMFNHQTHHRGQLTCILSQFGLDYGCMDLPVVVSEGSVGCK